MILLLNWKNSFHELTLLKPIFFQNKDMKLTFQKVLFAVLIWKSIDRPSGTGGGRDT